jgi:hypothetical protein
VATLSQTTITLLDHAKRLDPDGSTSAIAELLSQDNEILDDMPWVEGNLATGHRITMRTGLPASTWRKFNSGVDQDKSTTAQVDEACGMLEQFPQIDKDLADLNGNTASFRMSENLAAIEGMNQDFATALFYADTDTTPEKFMGLGPRFDSSTPASGENVILGGGSGSDNTSIWLVGWGENTVTGIYPKGSKAGLVHEDLGLDTVLDSNGKPFRAYRDHYQWKCGIAVKDWRYVVRIANIDVSELLKTAATGADLIDLMTRALERIKSLNGVRPAFYCNRTIRSFLRRQMVHKVVNSTLTMMDVGGKTVMGFSEVPVRRVDAITNAEATIS